MASVHMGNIPRRVHLLAGNGIKWKWFEEIDSSNCVNLQGATDRAAHMRPVR